MRGRVVFLATVVGLLVVAGSAHAAGRCSAKRGDTRISASADLVLFESRERLMVCGRRTGRRLVLDRAGEGETDEFWYWARPAIAGPTVAWESVDSGRYGDGYRAIVVVRLRPPYLTRNYEYRRTPFNPMPRPATIDSLRVTASGTVAYRGIDGPFVWLAVDTGGGPRVLDRGLTSTITGVRVNDATVRWRNHGVSMQASPSSIATSDCALTWRNATLQAAVSVAPDSSFVICDLLTGGVTRFPRLVRADGRVVTDPVLQARGHFAAFGGYKIGATVIDTRTGEQVAHVEDPDFPYSLELTDDGQIIWRTDGGLALADSQGTRVLPLKTTDIWIGIDGSNALVQPDYKSPATTLSLPAARSRPDRSLYWIGRAT